MIIREKEIAGQKVIWYTNKDKKKVCLFAVTKDENGKETYKLITKKNSDHIKIKKQNRRNKIVTIGLTLSCLIFLWKNTDTICQSLVLLKESPEIYKTLKEWNNLSDREKKDTILKQIDELIENNENYNEFVIETMKEKYPEYISDYGEYISKIDYLNTMFSTRFVKVNMLSESKKISENITEDGYYEKPYIYSIKNKDTFFHEKMHADNLWLTRTFKILIEWDKQSLNEETHASFSSKDGYDIIRAAYSLIGELIGPKKLEEYIFTEKPDEIWLHLKRLYPEKESKINQLEKDLFIIYKKRYKTDKEYDQELNEFWEIYSQLYQEPYGKNPEDDIVASYFKDILYDLTTLENKNKIDYGNTFKMGYFITDLEDRNYNYKKLLIQYLLDTEVINYDNRPYFYELWVSLSLINNEKIGETYEEFENSLIGYLNEEEIGELTEALLYCTTEDQKNACINWCMKRFKKKDPTLRFQKKMIK